MCYKCKDHKSNGNLPRRRPLPNYIQFQALDRTPMLSLSRDPAPDLEIKPLLWTSISLRRETFRTSALQVCGSPHGSPAAWYTTRTTNSVRALQATSCLDIYRPCHEQQRPFIKLCTQSIEPNESHMRTRQQTRYEAHNELHMHSS